MKVFIFICSLVLEVLLITFIGHTAHGQGMIGDSTHGKPVASGMESKTNSQTNRIEIKDFAFGPVTITVPAGAKVIWVNKDEEPHKVVSVDEVFKSKALDTDGEFSFAFDKPGTYKYFCSMHPRMVGTVVVADPKQNQSTKMSKAS